MEVFNDLSARDGIIENRAQFQANFSSRRVGMGLEENPEISATTFSLRTVGMSAARLKHHVYSLFVPVLKVRFFLVKVSATHRENDAEARFAAVHLFVGFRHAAQR